MTLFGTPKNTATVRPPPRKFRAVAESLELRRFASQRQASERPGPWLLPVLLDAEAQ